MHQGWLCWFWSYSVFLFSVAASASPQGPAPLVPEKSFLLHKKAMNISYNPAHKQADWAFYSLGPKELEDCYDRGSNFRPDPLVPSEQSAQLSDYAGSHYDRGHLIPAGDNKWNDEAMSQSFLLSNISPQPPAFNRGIWSRLELLVRAWAMKYDGIWVTTGPLLDASLNSIGANKVSVPKFFYKVIVTSRAGHRNGIALLLPTNASAPLATYAESIQRLEAETGLDFLKGLDLAEEKSIEENFNPQAWDFNAKFQYRPCQSKPGALNFFAPNHQ